MNPALSIVIPAKDEEGSLSKLHQEIVAVLSHFKTTFEIIIVDDGSTDNTFEKARGLAIKDRRVSVIKLRGNFGKSIALQTGFKAAKGAMVITMDADLQDNPEELPKFIEKINQGYDLAVGWKKHRHDPWHKVIPSRLLNNYLIPFLTGIKIHDTNCGFKAYKKQVLDNLNLYGELYRYIPIFAAKNNFRICEIEIKHRQRRFGKSKFGVERNIKGVLDLITVVFLTGYIKRPGHFFGGLGLLSFLIGFLIGLYITYLRITTGSIQYHQPLLFLGVLLITVGFQLITTGLLAELLVHFNQKDTDVSKYIDRVV